MNEPKRYQAPPVTFGPDDRVDPTRSEPDSIGPQPKEGEWHTIMVTGTGRDRKFDLGHPDVRDLLCEVSRLRKELAAAREALDPFARVSAILKPLNLDPKTPLWEVIPHAWPTLGDAERARAALEPRAEKKEN